MEKNLSGNVKTGQKLAGRFIPDISVTLCKKRIARNILAFSPYPYGW
jgi:hypothetical protein